MSIASSSSHSLPLRSVSNCAATAIPTAIARPEPSPRAPSLRPPTAGDHQVQQGLSCQIVQI